MKRNQYYRPLNRDYMNKKRPNHLFAIAALIAAFVMIYAAGTKACDELYLGAWSYHISEERDLNETHYLLACEKRTYIVGGMKNSHGDPTALVGKRFDLFGHGHIKSIVYVGATFGYYGCGNGDTGSSRTICPAVIPEISYTKYRVKPSILLLGNAVAISAKVGF